MLSLVLARRSVVSDRCWAFPSFVTHWEGNGPSAKTSFRNRFARWMWSSSGPETFSGPSGAAAGGSHSTKGTVLSTLAFRLLSRSFDDVIDTLYRRMMVAFAPGWLTHPWKWGVVGGR